MTTAKLIGAGLFLALASTATSAQSSTPALIQQFKDWGAYSYKESDGKVCFAISTPKKKLPKLPRGREHGDVYFFVSAWASHDTYAEPHFLVEYALKKNSRVKVDIDGDKFDFYTQGEGAWAVDDKEEAKVIEAMKKGRTMTVQAISRRGTNTKYVYSLSGVTAAIDAVGKACK